MGINYTIEEWEALDKKLEAPESNVKCPRCGKMLEFHDFKSACEVKCPTSGCLVETVRGL